MSLTVGDTRPALTGRATTTDTAGVTTGTNLTGATALALHIRRSDGSVITATATPVDPSAGTWTYTWAPTDLTVAGRWEVELQVTFSDSGIETFGPAVFYVQPQIA